ncbi:MAG TPA: hypothetical protein VHM70_01005 [Polyangiaceae bacterium]|nr:hypothetical protein [Polyangiaceae bacterium]
MSKISLTLPPNPESNPERESVMPLTVLGTIEMNPSVPPRTTSSERSQNEPSASAAAANGRVERWLEQHLDAVRAARRQGRQGGSVDVPASAGPRRPE